MKARVLARTYCIRDEGLKIPHSVWCVLCFLCAVISKKKNRSSKPGGHVLACKPRHAAKKTILNLHVLGLDRCAIGGARQR